ncbi:hypothetical protein C7972_103234 [Arenibacter sp. ARW7G5Y1]|nr:hypothetical protein C7972_103234 [Arenibacter sp. ARW7G5Y1]
MGNQDQFITKARLENEKEKMDSLFNGKAELIKFEGGHEINKEVLINLIK